MNQANKLLLLLPAAALLAACNPSAAPETALVDVAQAAARQTDRVSVEELAGWIIEGRQDFEIVDVRSATDFDSGHIGENLRLAAVSAGLAEGAWLRFHDDLLNSLLRVDGRKEAVCAVHAVGRGGSRDGAPGSAGRRTGTAGTCRS